MGTDFRIALMVFTVLAPAGAIAFVLMSARIIGTAERTVARNRLERCLVIPIGLCLVGLVSSATHLGTPDNALYVLAGIGRSPLSEEVLAAVVFIALSWLYWLVAFVRRIPLRVSQVLLVVASAAGLWLVFRISRVYAIPTIPTWNSPFVPLELWAVALATGPLVCFAVFTCVQRSLGPGAIVAPKGFYGFLVGVSIVAVAGCVLLATLQNQELSSLVGSYGTASELFPFYGGAIAGFTLLGMLGEVAALLSLRDCSAPKAPLPSSQGDSLQRAETSRASCAPRPAPALAAVLLVFAAAVVIRVPFYAMHMTIGY